MKAKILLITGGTGGHVLPAVNFANYLLTKNINCKIIVDKRGYKYARDFQGQIKIINSSNLNGSLFFKILGLFRIFQGFIQSLVFVFVFKPSIVISFGSYASFFPVISCIIIKSFYKLDLYVHEQNSIFGRTNKIFLNLCTKIFLNFEIKSKISSKYKNKTFIVGSPEKKITKTDIIKNKNYEKEFTIFIYGGSQGSVYIANFAEEIIKMINKENLINVKYILQCPDYMVKKISKNLNSIANNIIIKEYYENIEEILKNTSMVISRAGSGSINDLINFKIPSILIPLPSSKDNHQFYNASIIMNSGTGLVLDQNKNELNKAKEYIYQLHNDNNYYNKIIDRFNKIKVKHSNSLIYKLIKDEK